MSEAAADIDPAGPRSVAPQVGLILLAVSFQAFVASGFGLLLPLIREDLGLTFVEAGSLAGAATLVYALMQVPSGILADRFGPRRLFALGTILTNVLFLLFAQSGTLLAAVAIQAVSGVSRAFAFAPGLVLTSTWFGARRRATAMGLFQAGGQAWTVAFGIVAPAITVVAGWRTAVTVLGLLGLGFSLAYLLFGRARHVVRHAPGAPSDRTIELIRRPVVWVVGLVQFTRLAVVLGVAAWLPTYLIDEHGLPLALAGAVVAASALLTAPSNLLGGFASDRWARPYVVIGGSLAVIAGALVLLAGGAGVAGIGVAIILLAICQQLYFGPLFAVPIDFVGAGSASTVSGIGNLFANVGGFVAVIALGAIKDATGSLAPGFLALAVLCVAAIAGTWQLHRASLARTG